MVTGIIFGQVSVAAGVCWHVKHEMALCILVTDVTTIPLPLPTIRFGLFNFMPGFACVSNATLHYGWRACAFLTAHISLRALCIWLLCMETL
jgi:hypothetical protein